MGSRWLLGANKSRPDAQPELFIRLVPDKVNKTLSIINSGVGMTKAEEKEEIKEVSHEWQLIIKQQPSLFFLVIAGFGSTIVHSCIRFCPTVW